MGIYDRDWYRDSPRGGGWFHDLHPVGKIMLFLLVGSVVTLFVMNRWGSARRHHPVDFEDEVEQAIREQAKRRSSGGSVHEAAEQATSAGWPSCWSPTRARPRLPFARRFPTSRCTAPPGAISAAPPTSSFATAPT